MKYIFILFALLLTMPVSFAATTPIEKILNIPIKSVGVVDASLKQNRVYLNGSFTSPAILNPEAVKKIKGLLVYRVDLVYTRYRSSKTFNQRELNRKRLVVLQTLYPELFKNPLIQWRLVEQKEPTNPEMAKTYFHGFILYYRPAAGKEQSDKEMSYINDLMEGKTPSYEPFVSEDIVEVIAKDTPKADSLPATEKTTAGFRSRQVPSFVGGLTALDNYLGTNLKLGGDGKVDVRFTVTKTGEIRDATIAYRSGNVNDSEVLDVINKMPKWEPGKVKGRLANYHYTIPILLSNDKARLSPALSYSLMMYAEPIYLEVVEKKIIKMDSTILKVFGRNKQWKKVSLVCDVTSSMSPYTSQIMLWFKSAFEGKESLALNYTFFNDGDKKEDSWKAIGSTGGIYSGKAENIEELKGLLFKAMTGGYGGDIRENNVEAAIEAIKQCSDCTDLVMIADNFATPRDLALFKQVSLPLHIVLCGTSGGVNVEYINLAFRTKGSLHLIEQDIKFPKELSEGYKMTIGGEGFVYMGERFVRE
jgi:hypothetical protein